jgi:hypothetical protein
MMRINEIFDRIVKNIDTKSDVYYWDLANEMGINCYNFPEDERLESYWFASWICTDTEVGFKAYFLDNEPVAISTKKYRKSNEEFKWVSKEAYKNVKDYLMSLDEPSIDYIEDCDVTPFYSLEYNGQLLQHHKENAYYNEEPVKIVKICREPLKYGTDTEVVLDNGLSVNIKELTFPYILK